MANVILHPVAHGEAREHYLKTVKSPIDREKVLALVTAEQRALLGRHHSDRDLRAWGLTKEDRRWQRIQSGDVCLFYTGGENREYTGSTIVTFKMHNSTLARELWGERNGTTWEWMYFMRDFRERRVPAHELNRVAGFSPEFRLQGTMIPGDEAASERVISKFELRLARPDDVHQTSAVSLADAHIHFSAALRAAGLDYGSDHEQIVRSFLSSIATKPFVILTGLSGSGKTQLAIRFGEWLGADCSKLVPVRPDWTGSEAVFGYEDILQPAKNGRRAWHVPETLRFMLQAAERPAVPHLLILDEMNLAHVERYFADFLSGVESEKPCLPSLRREEDGAWRSHSERLELMRIPTNLWVAGTVNVDETTYMFSPKVLDRANTFEFRVKTEELTTRLRRPSACEQGPNELVRHFAGITLDHEWHRENPPRDQEWFEQQMRELHRVLSAGGYEFAHWVFYETLRFAAFMSALGEPSGRIALDFQVLQKVLPRLNGSRRELEPTLSDVGRFCYSLEAKGSRDETAGSFNPLDYEPEQAQLPRAFDKIRRMIRKLRANQFVSFTE